MKACPLQLIDGHYQSCEPEAATHLRLKVPGPVYLQDRVIAVQTSGTRQGTPNWTWNGSTEKPTLKPSVLTRWEGGDGKIMVCHSWITDGQVQFLSDTTHKYSGQTLDLLEVTA